GYTRYEVETGNITIAANKFYRLSLWVKTIDVSSASGAYISLINKDDEDKELTSFTKVNTKDYDEYYNDWCEITIVIRGSEDKDTNAALRFALGTGNRWANTLTSGSMYVANLSMTDITYANFNDTSTSTYVKSVNLTESLTYTFTNGEFNNYDHDDENLEGGVALNEQQFAATPEDWTISDSTQPINGKEDEETKEVTSLFAGVIALNPTSDDKLNFEASNQALAVVGEGNQNVFDNFYNYDPTLSDKYLDSLAGPNLLAIGSKDSKKYAIGFASTNVSLSSNSYYSLSVYAKTCKATTASIFLTGESSTTSAADGETYFVIKNATEANGEWTKYTFYIEVGNTSVSVKLNLWLGLDANYADVDGETEEERLENAKSAGMVFFDHIVQETINEEKYNEAVAGATDIKLSFLTDSFDALSTSVESRSELTKSDDWSGAADTSQASSNTKGGIIYADRGFLETVHEGDVDYVKILGKEYDIKDIEITTEELNDAKASGEYTGKTDDEITQALKEKKLLEQKKANWMPIDELNAHSGNRMLMINNVENSAYIYTSKSNSFSENSFYKVSVWVRTYGISGKENDDTIGANIELYLGSANEAGNAFIFTGIKADEWTKYEFYVQTRDDNVTSVTVKLSLGKYDTKEIDGKSEVIGLTKGFAMFDDVAIEKFSDEGVFENAKEQAKTDKKILTRELSSKTPGINPTDPAPEQPSGNTFNLDYLWWMIPTIVIGLVIIVVVVVLVIRKIKPVAKRATKKVSSPMSSEMLDTKRNKYDEGKE
ncbi:MAG: hypothetical protein K2J16_03475, partial [Clostridia bacterium]|nr:hypothetical protein [Clostridia bacterium]